jgi:hypothetical protein
MAKQRGLKVAAYGASATSTTLMYHFEIEHLLDVIFDDNPAKHHTLSPGAHVPVLPSEKIYDEKPDVICVLAWRYYKPILERHHEYAKAAEFFVPLPEFKKVSP